MQSRFRMVRERRAFLKQKRSATTIQSHARGKQVRHHHDLVCAMLAVTGGALQP
jgi:IQ calmodulin-binding motif